MTETEQKNKMFDIFNQEQGTFAYYTCGLLVVMIGYSFNFIIESSTKPYLWIPLLAILTMFISLGFGIYFIKYRLSNYHNTANLLNERGKTNNAEIKEFCKELIGKNGNKQLFWHNLHWWTIGIGPIIMLIWLVIITLN